MPANAWDMTGKQSRDVRSQGLKLEPVTELRPLTHLSFMAHTGISTGAAGLKEARSVHSGTAATRSHGVHSQALGAQ